MGIPVTEVRVHSFSELHEALGACRKDGRWLFRGQANPKWRLVPKLGRKPFDYRDEKRMLGGFKRDAFELSAVRPQNDLE